MEVWVRHFKGRPFFSLPTMAQVISSEVMQLKFGTSSVQDKVALEISQKCLKFLHHCDDCIKIKLIAVCIKHYLNYVA